ncbi:MAG: hypothetical protein ACRC92_26570 [Peptostreptococcaceae bacterium]
MMPVGSLLKEKSEAISVIKNKGALNLLALAIFKTIPDTLIVKATENGLTDNDVLSKIVEIVDKDVLPIAEFKSKAMDSGIYTSVYIAGAMEGLEVEGKRFILEAESSESVAGIVTSIDKLLGTKDFTKVSIEIEKRLKKALTEVAVANAEQKEKEEDLAGKIEDKVAGTLAAKSSISNSLSKGIAELEEEFKDNGDEGDVSGDVEGEETPDDKGEGEETYSNQDVSEIVEEDEPKVTDEQIAESVRLEMLTQDCNCFNIIDEVAIVLHGDDKNQAIAFSLAAKAMANFFDQLMIITKKDFADRLMNLYGVKPNFVKATHIAETIKPKGIDKIKLEAWKKSRGLR